MNTTIKPTAVAAYTSNGKRIHIAVEMNGFSQYKALCDNVAPHTLSSTDREATCKRCIAIATEIFAIKVAPKPVKLNATQEDTLRYFAGVKETGRGGKPKEGTYAKLRNLNLIERCDEFPYHQATEMGRAWIANA